MAKERSLAREKVLLLAQAALNKKAINPTVLDLRGLTDIADFFLIVSGNTSVQVRAIAEELERVSSVENFRIAQREGVSNAVWILLDLAEVVVHILRESERKFYDLEGLWKSAKSVRLPVPGTLAKT